MHKTIDFSRTSEHSLPLPSHAIEGDAGLDLRTTIDLIVAPGKRVLAPTGFAVVIPEGYVGLVHPRSGLAFNHGITVLNTPGTIDSGYRGELKVLLFNAGDTIYHARVGDRIAQLVIQEYVSVTPREIERLPQTSRGESGYGSTGAA